jgi:hypothetical protein
MIILKNLGVDRLSCAYFVRSEPPQGSRIFLEPGIVASGRRRGRWVRPCAQLAGSGFRAKPLRRTGRGRCARSLPGIESSGRRRGRRVRPRAAPLRRTGRGAVPDRSQASWPLGGAEVAGSGPVPSSLGQASCQAP